ncbi:MAG: conjugal transfer protein TraF, partial [Elusimicrobia bacterium]|nr:conjugal transfer protein TraF [Elusimicrobiota bacterium]
GQVENPSGFELPVGAQSSINGPLIQGIKDLNQLNQECSANPTTCGFTNQTDAQNAINSTLSNLGAGGANLDGGVGLNLKLGRLVLFANDLFYAGEAATIDNVHTSPVPGANNISHNTSTAYINGISMTEIGVGYGHELPWVPGLSVGANLKAIVGETGYGSIQIVSGTKPTLSQSNNTKQSIEPGIDLGALWDLNELLPFLPFRPRVGLVARNINAPSFKQPVAATDGGLVSNSIDVGRQVRLGAAISPFHWWNIAADADLTQNHTVTGQPSREVALGTEINIFNRPWINIPLRAGLSKNTALSNSGYQWSLGAGLNFLHVIIDAAGTISQDEVTTQSQGKTTKIPESFGGMIQVSVLFGGAPAKKKAS